MHQTSQASITWIEKRKKKILFYPYRMNLIFISSPFLSSRPRPILYINMYSVSQSRSELDCIHNQLDLIKRGNWPNRGETLILYSLLSLFFVNWGSKFNKWNRIEQIQFIWMYAIYLYYLNSMCVCTDLKKSCWVVRLHRFVCSK